MYKLSVIFLNLWFYCLAPFVLAGSLLIYTPFVAAVRVFSRRRAMYYFRKSINLYGRSVGLSTWPWIRIKVHNLPPPDGTPYVFVENHTSSFDPFVQGFLPYELVQAARGWALRLPVLGLVAKFAGYLDVDALSGEEMLKKADKLLEQGVSVVFFPEGTRHPGPEMGPFHSLAFRTALGNSVPIVPVIIRGIADKPRKGSLLMRPGKIDIYCLDVIKPDDYSGKSAAGLKKYIRKIMEKAITGYEEN